MLQANSIYSCGDHAITVSFGNLIEEAIHNKVMALFHRLITMEIPGVKDIIPAYTTVTVVYDIKTIKTQANSSAYDFINKYISIALNEAEETVSTQTLIKMPVCYDVAFGIDLERMARLKNISIEEIIYLHTSPVYHVYMLGFLPGFAYMGKVDERLATQRLPDPRINVAAGSVGIAGIQTGIYPFESPGGWNIIGRTPLSLFDASNEEPCLLQSGNTVQFTAITKDEYQHIKNSHEHPHS